MKGRQAGRRLEKQGQLALARGDGQAMTKGALMAHTTLHSESILFVSFELSKKKWMLTSSDGGTGRRRVQIAAANWKALEKEFLDAKKKFRLPESARVIACYEAGRDGFWIARKLESLGVTIYVVDSASIEVNRRLRRLKNDKVDGEALVGMLIRYVRGEKKVWRVARLPNDDAEDARRPTRELEQLKRERTRHRNRISALLALHGLELAPGSGFEDRLDELRQWNGRPLEENLKQELVREMERLRVVEQHIRQIKTMLQQKLKSAAKKTTTKTPAYIEHVRALMQLRGIGPSAWVLVLEFFAWRKFSNGKEVGALAGLVGTPYSSGDSVRDQGISKAGNRRVRALMIELAWCWLKYQPESKLTRWYNERYGASGKRSRRLGIVAVARKLLVALWRYQEFGELPEGAELKIAA
jgi:transposase